MSIEDMKRTAKPKRRRWNYKQIALELVSYSFIALGLFRVMGFLSIPFVAGCVVILALNT